MKLDALSADERRELLELLELKERLASENKLKDYVPYKKQAVFHAQQVRERLLVAANQVGKCCTVSSHLEMADGTRMTFGELYERQLPFHVKSWDGHRVVTALAVTPIKKPAEPCVRLWLADGKWIEVALKHRLLSASGDYVFCESTLGSLPSLQVTKREFSQSIQLLGGARSLGKLRGFLVDCLAGLRSCDEQLRKVTNSVRAWLRQPVCVQQRNFALSYEGGYLSRCTNIPQQVFDHPSSLCVFPRIEGRFFASLDRAVCRFSEYTTRCIEVAQRTALALILRPLSTGEVQSGKCKKLALFDPFGMGGNQIIAYESIGIHDVYDFTVPETQNYITAGIVHHNTVAGAYEMAYHLTGLYPEWWQGKRFEKPIAAWAGSVSTLATRDTVQRLVCGRPGQIGTGSVPKSLITGSKSAMGTPDLLDHIKVKHTSGGESSLAFKSYEQGREKWQGESLQVVWFDEEPGQDIYSEGLTRTNATDGITYMTFTPLLGMSEVVKRFLIDKSPGTGVTIMTLEDAEHYTPEQRAAIIASYPVHERDARTKGVPSMGSGRVFPILEDDLMEGSFAIPKHWPRICGVDFGWDHPTAAAWVAWDRDSDTVHVYDCYRKSESTPVIHAATIRSKGDWIPVSWPHDGLQHDKGSGIALAEQYRALGVRMLRAPMSNAPAKGKAEGTGGNSVEAGLMEMMDRMQTGRFKVARHLHDWWEEFRLYHRKDGKVVKEGDDILSATRYACAMLRFAKVQEVKHVVTQTYQPSDAMMGVLG